MVGATAEKATRCRAAAAGLGPQEAGNLPGLRRVLSSVVELPPGPAISGPQPIHYTPGERFAARLLAAREKRVSSAGFCLGTSVQACALRNQPASPRSPEQPPVVYLSLSKAISKQVIIE